MQNYLIKNALIVNENIKKHSDVLIKNGRIEQVGNNIHVNYKVNEIPAETLWLLPGVIDDQVHFREPGLTHKASIYTEAKAAVAGGITSFMEMPNTMPPALTQNLLEEKYLLAKEKSLANYSFYMGVSNSNIEEVLQINNKKNEVCGIKVFMGSSTGDMLVDNISTLDTLFKEADLLIAAHCEEEAIIQMNKQKLLSQKPELEIYDHPFIRNEEACFASSSKAIALAKKYNSRLHILHISTENELTLFSNAQNLSEKKITSEVCVHHLHFTSDDYSRLGNLIKCNPAIKAAHHKQALWNALQNNTIDVIATDHAPHTLAEKQQPYEKAPSGLPLVQHSLLLMLYYVQQGVISIEKVVEKMCHAVATCFQIKDRGFIREGYYADVVLVNPNQPFIVQPSNILYKCAWSPLNGFQFPATVTHTFVNGHLVFHNFQFNESNKGMRLYFDR